MYDPNAIIDIPRMCPLNLSSTAHTLSEAFRTVSLFV